MCSLTRGTSGIDVDLRRVDIDQCPLPQGSADLNIFAASDKCKKRTTRVRRVKYGQVWWGGVRRGYEGWGGVIRGEEEWGLLQRYDGVWEKPQNWEMYMTSWVRRLHRPIWYLLCNRLAKHSCPKATTQTYKLLWNNSFFHDSRVEHKSSKILVNEHISLQIMRRYDAVDARVRNRAVKRLFIEH